MVSLVGMVDATFGSFICFRGFAPYSVLANASQSDPNYQRKAKDSHIKELQDFLTSNVEGRFFPEIVLGASWQGCGIDDGSSVDSLLRNPTQKKRKVFKGDGVSFTVGRPIFRGGITRACVFRFDDKTLLKKPFFIIDGNHRLQALPKPDSKNSSLTDPTDVHNQKIPFCIVLFLDDYQCQKNGALFFHNINYRAVPIPEEKNLSIILTGKTGGSYLFSDEALKSKEIFGMPYYFARKAIEAGVLDLYPILTSVVSDEQLTFTVDILKLFLKNQDEGVLEGFVLAKLRKALNQVEQALEEFAGLNNYKRSMLEALVYCFLSGKDGDQLVKWLAKNQLSDVVDVSPTDVLSIFERTHARGPLKVFVAMPYVSHKRVADFNRLFTEVLNDLSTSGEDGIRYKLMPIMRFRGAAQRIDQRLIKCIKECDVVVADITGNNENVIFEVGLAEGSNKPFLLIREDKDGNAEKVFAKREEHVNTREHPPFDMDKLQYIPYSSTGYYNDIKGIVKRHLPVIVNELLESRTSTRK